jgi:hypothetical protein
MNERNRTGKCREIIIFSSKMRTLNGENGNKVSGGNQKLCPMISSEKRIDGGGSVGGSFCSRANGFTPQHVSPSRPHWTLFSFPSAFFFTILFIIFLILIIPCAISPSERSTGPAIYFGTKKGDSSISLHATHGPGPRV